MVAGASAFADADESYYRPVGARDSHPQILSRLSPVFLRVPPCSSVFLCVPLCSSVVVLVPCPVAVVVPRSSIQHQAIPLSGEYAARRSLPASPGVKRIARVLRELTRPALSAILRLIPS